MTVGVMFFAYFTAVMLRLMIINNGHMVHPNRPYWQAEFPIEIYLRRRNKTTLHFVDQPCLSDCLGLMPILRDAWEFVSCTRKPEIGTAENWAMNNYHGPTPDTARRWISKNSQRGFWMLSL